MIQGTLVVLAFLAATAYIGRGVWRSWSGSCGGCGAGKKPRPPLIPASDLLARFKR